MVSYKGAEIPSEWTVLPNNPELEAKQREMSSFIDNLSHYRLRDLANRLLDACRLADRKQCNQAQEILNSVNQIMDSPAYYAFLRNTDGDYATYLESLLDFTKAKISVSHVEPEREYELAMKK